MASGCSAEGNRARSRRAEWPPASPQRSLPAAMKRMQCRTVAGRRCITATSCAHVLWSLLPRKTLTQTSRFSCQAGTPRLLLITPRYATPCLPWPSWEMKSMRRDPTQKLLSTKEPCIPSQNLLMSSCSPSLILLSRTLLCLVYRVSERRKSKRDHWHSLLRRYSLKSSKELFSRKGMLGKTSCRMKFSLASGVFIALFLRPSLTWHQRSHKYRCHTRTGASTGDSSISCQRSLKSCKEAHVAWCCCRFQEAWCAWLAWPAWVHGVFSTS
mmetsp:Transcript_144493/g.448645  ORF Transcript_144493/g.448645 Transcript_144493/m.448645 type:complete len:270 (-) Transcript_144493:1020-1829(-)